MGRVTAPDLLGDVLPAHAPRRRAGTATIAAIGVSAALVMGTGAFAAASLSGGGPQPEDVLPAGAIGFVKLDLDPSATQKERVYGLTTRFPLAAKELRSADTLREDLLRLAFDDSGTELDYDTDVAPWIGDRVGVAFLAADGDEPDVVVAVAHTDAGKARTALAKAAEEEDLAFTVLDDYALLGEDQAVVDAAAGAEDHLADDEGFTEAVDALDGDQVALAWADLGRVWDALPADLREQAEDGLDPTGQVVVGVHALDDAIEVVGRTLGVKSNLPDDDGDGSPGTGLAGQLPAQAIAALAAAGLDQSVEQAYDAFVTGAETVVPDLEAQAAELGLTLPDDITTVLGDEAGIAVWGDQKAPEVLARTRTDDAKGAREVIARVLDATGTGQDVDDVVQSLDDGIAIGTPGGLDALNGKGLRDRAEFTAAAPDAQDAAFVLWVSIQDALELTGLDEPDAEPLDALGLTVSARSGGDVELRLRVTLR